MAQASTAATEPQGQMGSRMAGEAESQAEAAPLHLVLVDGSGFIFRAFHALPPMTRPDGTPVNAVFGFTNMLAKLLRDHVGTHLAVIFDAGRTTFRNRMYGDYKAHRPEPAPELIPQFALVREASAAFGVPSIEVPDWEADDLIATYARVACEAGGRVTIVSSDKDMMQLIRPGVMMHDPIKQKPIGAAEVMERFGVPPEKVVEVQALIGDSVDNVPGVPGIGPKTACQLIQEFGDLEGVLAAAPAMKASKRRDMLIEHAENARLSKKLVILCDEVPLPVGLESLVAREPDRARLGEFLHRLGFRSTAIRLGLEQAAATQEPAPSSRAEAATPAAPFGNYETVVTMDALAGWIAEAVRDGLLSIEVEDGPAGLIGLALAVAPGRACYVPLGHEADEPVAPARGPGRAGCARAGARGPLGAEAVPRRQGRAARAASRRLRARPVQPVDDTMLISFAQEAGAHGHGRDELAMLHLGHKPIPMDEVTGTGRNRLPFARTPVAARDRLRRRGCRPHHPPLAPAAPAPAPAQGARELRARRSPPHASCSPRWSATA